MSKTNQISGVDTLGYEWHAACGDALEPEARADGSVAMLNFQDDGGHFSEREAVRLATFLLAAIGPDAAREALAKLAPWPCEGDMLPVTERLAEEVRIAWVHWAHTQPYPKSSWLVPWANLGEQDREADRAIARHFQAIFAPILASKDAEIVSLRARAERAEKRLAAVLQLPIEEAAAAMWSTGWAMVEQDAPPWSEAPKKDSRAFMAFARTVFDLIRLRATEGAEAPTGAAI